MTKSNRIERRLRAHSAKRRRVTDDDASVDVTLNRSGSVSPNPVVIGDVAVGDTESESVSVSLGSSAATGTYAVTATTPDSEKTLTFVAVSSDDAESDGGGTAGGGGGTAGAGPAPPPSTEDPDEPENATDDPTNETDDPTNATDDDPTNATDDPTDGEDDPVDGELADGDDENNAEDDGIDTESGVATDGESGGDDTSDEDESADGTPGFGPAIGVLAIFGAAFLVGRRGDAAVASNSRTSSRVERARTEAKRAQKRRRKRKPPRRDAQSRSKAGNDASARRVRRATGLQLAELAEELAAVLLVGVDALDFENVALQLVERDVEGVFGAVSLAGAADLSLVGAEADLTLDQGCRGVSPCGRGAGRARG